jgi:hypothetical protein
MANLKNTIISGSTAITGSWNLTGNLTVNGNVQITGSVNITGSLLLNGSTPGGGGASLSASVSNASPAYSSSITITATPTGITPTSYTFTYPNDSTGIMRSTTQASASLSIITRGYSDQTIIVTATDGVSVVGTKCNINVASMTQVTDFLTNTGITDTTITGSIRTLALSLDDAGLWSPINVIYPFVGGTATTHKYNLKDPRDLDAAYRLVFSGGWTHNSNGVTGNGTNTYADTKFNNTSGSQNSICFGVYNRTTGSAQWDMAGSQTPRTQLVISYSNSAYWDINNSANSATIAVGSARILGLVTANRYDSNNTQWANDGVGMRTAQLTTSAPASTNFVLGAFNTSATLSSARNYALCFIASGLTALQLATLSNIINTFQTNLSRNV